MIITASITGVPSWRWVPNIWTHYSMPGVWAAWGKVRVHIEVERG